MANIFTRLFGGREKPVQQEERGLSFGLGYNNISSYQTTQAMRLSAVYCATNQISNSVSLLPLKVIEEVGGNVVEVDHPLNRILNLTPNNRHNHFSFFKLMIESLILRGNAYALIVRDENLNIKSLEPLNPDAVQPMLQKDGSVKYIVSGLKKAVDASDIIHLYQHLDDTFNGISVLKYADMVLNSAWSEEEHSQNFFSRGGGLLGILSASKPLNNEQKKQIAESWDKSIKYSKGGGIAIIPEGLSFQSISISPEDSQLLQSRQYSIVEIARFFGISPVRLYDLTHVSYSTLEQTNLSYLQETILPYTKLIMDEFNRKLFKPSEIGKYTIQFDYTELLSTNKKDEAEYFKTLLNAGVFSINDVRKRLGVAPVPEEEGGDMHILQLSYANMKDIYEGNYIKENAQTQTQKVDNNAKKTEE